MSEDKYKQIDSTDYPWIDNSYMKVERHGRSKTIISVNNEGLRSFADQLKLFSDATATSLLYFPFPGDLEEGSTDLEIIKINCSGRKNPPGYDLENKINRAIENATCSEELANVFCRIANGEEMDVSDFEAAACIYNRNMKYDVCQEIMVDPEIIDSLIASGSPLILNDEFWHSVIMIISADSLSDRTIGFLYKNRLAVMEMCHKNLPEKWLIKYSAFDDEPLYKLADRYMHEHEDNNFVKFTMKYAVNSEPLFRYMAKYVPNSKKWKKLIFLGMHSENCNVVSFSKECAAILQIGISSDTEEIRFAYEEHKRDAEWLLSIAENPNTTLDILKDLSNISQIQLAKKIRMAADETIKIKLAANYIE